MFAQYAMENTSEALKLNSLRYNAQVLEMEEISLHFSLLVFPSS